MNDLASADPNIQTAMLEVISEGVSGGLLVYDRNDLIVFASQQLLGLLPVPKSFLAPGTRLRDFLGATYDGGGRFSADTTNPRRMLSREDWIAEQIAALWKERADSIERRSTERWLSFSKRRLSSGYGVCVVRDVSDMKKREDQWRIDMERVQITEEVLDNLPFSVTVRDSNLTFVAANKQASRFLDRPVESILGRKGTEVYPPDVAGRLDRINRNVLETGESVQLPELVTRPDGSQVAIIATKYRIGKPGRYYMVTAMQDITGFVEPAEDGGEPRPRVSRDDLFASSINRLDSSVAAPAAAKGEPGEISVSSRKVLVVSADPLVAADALEVLYKLHMDASTVRNAEELTLFLKLAKEAGVVIDLVVIDDSMERQCLEIASRQGIEALSIEGYRMRRGLASETMRLLGHQPPADAAASDAEWQISSELERPEDAIDILVAEDNEVNQIVFSQILEGFGYRYAIAADGEEAVRLWRERAPRLVLMDVTLPKLTGFEASARIRALETIDNSVPIIGVLAQAFDRDRDECFASGMNDVILKPISPEALEATFWTYLDDSTSRTYA